jgi:2,3-bisphosphoglycerate-independent phosphoglycerate mutase
MRSTLLFAALALALGTAEAAETQRYVVLAPEATIGHLHATIEAMEVIDECMARLLAVIDELGGVLVYTADHGNADIMFTESNGERTPKTSHTLSPVPFVVHDAAWHGEYRIARPDGAGLANVAATLLGLLGFAPPADYAPAVIAF